jgi:RNA polymerase sigma-70 factor, ECF subfamily
MDADSISSTDRTLSVDEAEAFESLYREHSRAVLRYAVRCVGRPEVAEEITSDAFLALYRNLKTIDQSRLPAWLFTVVRNLATSYWRRSAVERKYAPQAEERVETTEPSMMTSILDLPQLKPIHRNCLILRYVHDMERSQIAARLGLTENQVKSCLQYALELLRNHMMDRGNQ